MKNIFHKKNNKFKTQNSPAKGGFENKIIFKVLIKFLWFCFQVIKSYFY